MSTSLASISEPSGTVETITQETTQTLDVSPLTGPTFYDAPDAEKILTRGEAIQNVVNFFDLENRYKTLIDSCYKFPDECFFVFSAMSDFDGIKFKPLLLYPDVSSGNKYAGAIDTATILGLVHGYLNEDQTPFHPNYYITRIQALKVILGASQLLSWKDKFELDEDYWQQQSQKGSFQVADVNGQNPDEWWYGRYVAFALDAGIAEDERYFRPNDAITSGEMTEFMARALDYENTNAQLNEQAVPQTQQPTDPSTQAIN